MSADEKTLDKGVPIEPTGEDCPVCPDGKLVKPRSEVPQCPNCLYVNNPLYLDNELVDFELTHRQGRRLLRTFGYDHHGTPGDIGTRLRRFCHEQDISRDYLNDLLADLRGTSGYERGDST
ncbi:hypothetical protein [Natrinema soli]|uniref:Uncharacterized protein n=1 Tax=Natrinema soli TaxID=1930624 RepID=A0ABD5SND7_9EURY|nr:hypothetical protein [Natrinema soli]